MQFKYPEILYALFLLLIPIIVHLFQLQRFEKVAFTNVQFLKKVALQTRKSAKLKKFLILVTRLGLFTALILAFAQPYFSKNKQQLKPQTVLYLDNSLSMQAKRGTNEIFRNAIQDIISSNSNIEDISILTNNDFYKDLSDKELKNQLLSLNYYPIAQDLKTVILKTNKALSKKNGRSKHVIFVSDFQTKNKVNELHLDSTTQYSFVQLLPQKKENIAIDSIYISSQNGSNINLTVKLKTYNTKRENLSVSLFKENILVGKTSCKLEKNSTNTVMFKIPFKDSFNGKLSIEDNLIPFDNTLYFSLNKQEKIEVLAIGEQNKFLSKIYTNTEFNWTDKKRNQLDYNKIASQNLIVLNELENIPTALQKELSNFVLKGGSLVIIPATKLSIENYNQFFESLKIGKITGRSETEHQINTINFSHPILDNVFEKQIKNFQYPNVKKGYEIHLKNASSILRYDNQHTFISESKLKKGKIYCIAAPINRKNSNFKNSPLIVPIFYNFGKQSFNITALYYTIGNANTIDIQTKVKNDEVIHIEENNNKENSIIPFQQVSQNKVQIITEDNLLKAGFYQVKKKDVAITNIAYNYNRLESNTQYANIESELKQYKNVQFSTDIKQMFQEIKDNYSVTSYWKWFVVLAILFWIIEMLLVKFMKGS